MIEQQGQVISATRDTVAVRLGGTSGCPACNAGKGCGAGIFGRLLNRKPVVLDLSNGLGSPVGQAVIVGLPESLLLRLVLRLYLLPLLAGLAGAVFGHYIAVRNSAGDAMVDGAALLGAVLAGAVALAWNRRRENEFRTGNAVHVLRHADRSFTEVCARENAEQEYRDFNKR
jgi:sigma-E factor negative regulatory protein RseC